MSIIARMRALPRWARVSMVVAATGGAALIILLLAQPQEQTRRTPPPRDMTGMQGMEGMDMEGMDMSTDGSVRLSAAQIQQFGITFGTVEQRVLAERIRASGVITFDETRVSALAPKFAGVAERLHVGFTGAPVQRGQALLDVYSPELIAAQEELLVAARLARGAPAENQDLLGAARTRLRLLDISDAQITQILRSGQSRRTLTLYAPASGVVVEKNVVAGQAFGLGQLLYRIADLSTVWVEIELREADAGLVRVGNTADVELQALPGRVFTGRIDYIYPTLEAQARTLKARVRVSNPGNTLKPGMYATARITIPMQATLSIPTTALIRTGERSIVFVDLGRGRIAPQEVIVGRVTDEYAEILSGVEPGQRVVTSAQFLIDSESNLAEVMRSMIGQMGSGDMSGRR
ncbi:MAG: efflux RND transporter periplasmic adaptor subunit [Gemmatimonadota bacterium]